MLVLDDYAMYMLQILSTRRDLVKEFTYLQFERLRPSDEAEFLVALEKLLDMAKDIVFLQIRLVHHIVQLAYGHPPHSLSPEEYEDHPTWYLEIPSELVNEIIEEHLEIQDGDEESILSASVIYEFIDEGTFQLKIGYPPAGYIDNLYDEALEEIGEN